MATRVTEAEVIEIMDTALEEAAVTPYVKSANIFVTAALGTVGLSDDVLTEIERWLSAHMIAITKERQAKDEGAGSAYIKYTGEWAKGLEQTSYGQMALMLDTSGTLKNMAEGKKQASTWAVPGA